MEGNIQRLRTQNLDRDVQDRDSQQQRRRNQKSRSLGRYNLKSRIDMTPQEKAQELVDKMTDEIPSNNSKDIMTFIEVDLQASKQCALIAVEFAIEFAGGDMNEQFDKIIYLVEVKHEIEQL
jgi:spore cortex formation protein SpoVR/YcgB (stage V sporulation)